MEEGLSKETLAKFKAMGIYQIVGGVLGLGITIFGGIQVQNLSGVWVFFLIALLLYCYSIYCGNQLLEKKESGLRHSLIHQYLQLLHIFILSAGFKYVSGISLAVGLNANTYDLVFNFDLSTWEIRTGSASDDLLVSINLIAVFAILFIQKLQHKILSENSDAALLHEESSIS